MKRNEIEAGHVYAFSEHRPSRHLTSVYYKPILILSATIYETDRETHRLVATDGAPRRARGLSPSRGLPAVILDFDEDGPDYEAKLGRVLDLAEIGTINSDKYLAGAALWDQWKDAPDKERLGRYKLVTSTAYLHGDYRQIMDEQKKARESAARRRDEREAQQAQDREDFRNLTMRLDALGITGTYLSSHRQVSNLTIDAVTRLVTMAEQDKLRVEIDFQASRKAIQESADIATHRTLDDVLADGSAYHPAGSCDACTYPPGEHPLDPGNHSSIPGVDQEEEPPVEDFDPGPGVDDQGGMSEVYGKEAGYNHA